MSRRDLARAFEDALGKAGVAQVCVSCGFPNEEGRSVVLLDEGEELRDCASCGNPIDHDGRSVGLPLPNGEVRVVVLRVTRGARLALNAKRIEDDN